MNFAHTQNIGEKMKQIIYFKCETCGKLSEDREEIL